MEQRKKTFYQSVTVLLFLYGSVRAHPFVQKTGDQAKPGQCLSFKWGGQTGIHWYSCCNNCNSSDTSCDGKTYHSASKGNYCNSCGVDNLKGDGLEVAGFHCGGCRGQNYIQSKCITGLRKVYNIPGFCWAFAMCFRDKCEEKFEKGMALNDTSFDLQCTNGETVQDSPTDCCSTVNAMCKWTDGRCPPPCCGEPTCCGSIGG